MNTATVTADGLAVLELDTGQRHQLHAGTIDDARKQSVSLAIDHARATGQPLTLLARDPSAEHLLEILPDGTVRPAEPAASPFAPPTDQPPAAATPPPPAPAVEVLPNTGDETLDPARIPASQASRAPRRGGALAVGAALTLAVGAAASLALWQPWHTTAPTGLTQPSAAASPAAPVSVAVAPAVPAAATGPGIQIPAVTIRPARWASATGWEARREAREQARRQARQARQWSTPTTGGQLPAYQPPTVNTPPQPAAPAPAYQPPTKPAPANPAPRQQPSVRIYPDPQIIPDTN